MKILAIETGGAWWGAACAMCDTDEGKAQLVSYQTSEQPRELSQGLFACIASTLDMAHWKLENLDAIVVGLGPGSWTGLRIGITVAKTLAQAREIPIAGLPSFDATAQAIWREGSWSASTLLAVLAPSRPGELYAKIYECDEDYLAVAQSEWLGAPQIIADTLGTESLARGIESPLVLTGADAESVAALLDAAQQEYSLCGVAPNQVLLELAVAGAVKIASDEADDPLALQPLYLAPSNAERNLFAR